MATGPPPVPAPDTDRRTQVLRVALTTFARFGYRKTSMEQVARDAGISRPGLYFLFDSKQTLFRAAVTLSLHEDLAAAELALTAAGEPLAQRLVDAFDRWAGRYVGLLTRDVAAVIDDNPELLGPVAEAAPQRFAHLVEEAVAEHHDRDTAEQVTRTLISASIGLKHQVGDRQSYLERLGVAVALVLPAPPAGGAGTRR